MASDAITAWQPASGARRIALLGFAAALFVVAMPTSPAAAMLVDRVAHRAQACTMTGDGGSDSLGGTAGRDVICGLAGGDRLRGQRGHDVLLGGAGGDLLQGKSGRDRLEGAAGNDRMFGGAGADDLRGGAGRDSLGGGLGADELSGGAGRDIAYFGQRTLPVHVTIGAGANDGTAGERDDVHADVENIRTGPGNDVVHGSGGSNRLIGAGGDDQLFGARGSDVLVGGDGNDRLDAREGASAAGLAAQAGSVDRVMCGGGNDTAFVDSVDIVDPGCENVVGAAGTSSPPSGGQPPAGGQGPSAPQGQAPMAVNDSVTVVEDSGAGAIDVLANDTDTDGGPKTIASASDPANGTVVLTGGSPGARTGLTYQPDPNFCGAETFTYELNGGSTATVSVTVTCVDDLPTAVDDSASIPEDSAATPLAVLANDTDPDGDPTTIASVSDPANGTVVLTGGLPGARTGLTYEPDPSYCSATPDTFTYTLNGGSMATVSVTVTCGDDAPTAVNDTATVGEDSAAGAVAVLTNDTDADGGPMTIASASDPANGTVVLTGGSPGTHTGLTYQPDANFCSATPDTFTYTLNGGSTATVSVTVTCVDDAPTAVNDIATVAEDSAAGAIDVLANDTDPDGGAKTISSASDPAHGMVVLTGGSPGARTGLTYQPDANYCGPDTFEYTVNGGSTATVTVTVTCGDDPPTAVNDADTVPEDSAATPLAVLANDTDADGGPMTIASASDPANGTVVVTGGSPGAHTGLTYQPDPSFCNNPPGTTPDTFMYTLNGGSTATVSVTVTCGDDAPTAVNDSATVGEDSAAGAIAVLANDTDIDGGPMTIASASDPANGTVALTGGTPGAHTGLTYQPDANFCSATPDTFTYTLNGGSTATVSVTVTCVDDLPTAVGDSLTVAEDSAATAVDVLANDTDPDGGTKTISSASDPANGTVVVTGGAPGTGLTYQPDANFCGSDSFTYTVNGGSTATVSVTVTCAPDDPVVDTSPGSTPYTENAAATVVDAAVTVSDPDAGTMITGATVKITGGGAEDVLALGGTDTPITASFVGDTLTLSGTATTAAYQTALRAVTYRNSSENPSTAPRTVTFTVTDEGSRTGSDSKGITVSAVDDPPTAVGDSATVLEDAAATAIDVLSNDTDVDAGPKTISSASDPANGTVVLTGGGAGARTGLTYQPDPNYCNSGAGGTPDTFTYTVNGGSSATVSMTVTCVNDAPVADDEAFDGANGAIGNTSLVVNDPDDGAPALGSPKKSISGDILAGDSDIDGPGPLTVTPGTFATNDGGSVTIEADGDFIYINDPADNCADTSDFFDYTLSDGNPAGPGPAPGTDTGRVTISVAGCVWYVSNNATGNSGTSTAPFDTLTQAETASANNHTVFVFDGDNRATGYGGNGYTLNSGERLIGEHEGLTVDPDQGGPLASHTLHPANPGAHPTLTATNADVIDLDDANEIRGLNLDPSGTGGGIAGTTGDVSGTIDDVNINDTTTFGTQPGFELDGTSGSFAVSNFTVNTNGATGVRLNNAGTVAFAAAGTISITSANAPALNVTGTVPIPVGLGISTFDDITVTGSGSGGVNLTNTTGTTTFGDGTGTDLALTTTSGATPAFGLANAGTVSVPAAGTANVSATGGPAVDVTGTSGATLAFDAVSSTNSASDGVNLAGLGAGTFTANSSSAITSAATIDFDLDGGTGAITYDGTITDDVGQLVRIANTTGGTKDFNGNITDGGDGDGSGIALTTNTGATIRFDGGLTLATGGNAAFAATGGGTVAVTDPNAVGTAPDNTLATTTATALNIANTSIQVNGVNFRSIASNGAASGIVLNATGAAGGLTVASNGGTCTSAATCTGGAIQGSTGAGINLTNVGGGVSLTRMSVNGGGDDGIRGSSVSGLSLANSVVLNNGNAVGERGIDMFDLTGSGGIASSTVSGSSETNVRIENNTATALTAFNVTASTVSSTSTVTGDDGILVLNDGAGAMSVTVTGSTFTDNKGDHFQAASDADASGSINVIFDNNTLDTTLNGPSGGSPVIIGGGITINTSGTLDINFRVANNSIQRAFDDAINLNLDPGSQAGANFVGTITGNTIGTTGVLDSGSESSNTITFAAKGAGTATVAITNNNVRQFSNAYGIVVSANEGSPVVNATVTGNTVKEPGTFALNGIRVDAGATAGPPPDSSTLCVNLTGNNATGSAKAPPSDTDIRLRQRFNTTIRLPGYTGANNDTTAVNNFVSGNNTGSPTVSSVFNVPGGGGFVGGAACATP